ncbi:unnamed protein product [Caenorhabditis auriculariae]|uniref:Uncharacterized protein n=1 Tax=Caenorhabditis auriculariae TaxID=2777116 RepID=A0A8S1H325_9PELO|nr:unnamed protein product [Caenorhabditis auriculariae]
MDVCIVELRMAAEISHSRIGPTMSDFEVRVEKRPKAAKNFDGPQQDYNIVKRTTVGGHGVKDDVITLPITSFDPSLVEDSTTRRLGQRVQSQGVRVEELVHNYFHIRKGKQIRRAIVVPTETLDNNAPSSSKSLMGMALVCVPTLQHDAVDGEISRFESLQRLIQKSERESETIDPNTIQFLWILQNWLVAGMKNKNFIPMLFHRPPARGRILLCAHNPAYFQQESQCYRNVSLSVHKRNFMWLMVLRYEKFFLSVMNPSYNQVDIEDDTSRLYFYKGMKRVETKGRGMSAGSSSVNMTPRFPLHKAAEDDDILKMQQLLHDGYDPNERDDQNWTPLHHACFHGRQEAINMLVKSPLFTMVNAQNNGGATPLHYAVIHGNVHIIEFLTSHASIDVNIVDNSGMKPIDYCNDNTIKQFLLNGIYKSKIIVETDIGPFSVKTSTNPKQATAVQIMKELAREIRLSFKQMDCFALYVYSESLELQLPKDAVLNDCLNLQKWHSNLRKFCGQAKEEQPRLKFRRNAHATVSNELDADRDSL